MTSVAHAAGEQRVSYRLIKKEVRGQVHLMSVRLPERTVERALQVIARKLKADETKFHSKTVVNFYLPGMRLENEAWASVVFEMAERAEIKGLRHGEIEDFVAEAARDKRDVIGAWILSTPAKPGKLTLYRDGKRRYAEWKLGKREIVVERVYDSWLRRGMRYDFVEVQKVTGPKSYFVVTKKGRLEIRVGKKIVAAGKKIDTVLAARRLLNAATTRKAMKFEGRSSIGGPTTDVSVHKSGNALPALPPVDPAVVSPEIDIRTTLKPGSDNVDVPIVPSTALIRSPTRAAGADFSEQGLGFDEDKALKVYNRQTMARRRKAAASKAASLRYEKARRRRLTAGDIARRSFGQ